MTLKVKSKVKLSKGSDAKNISFFYVSFYNNYGYKSCTEEYKHIIWTSQAHYKAMETFNGAIVSL
jgi:hypothetical protein